MDLCVNKMYILMLCVCLVVHSSQASFEPDFLAHIGLKKLPSEHLNRVLVCLKTENQLTALTKFPKHNDIRFELIDSFSELNIEYHYSVQSCQSRIEEVQATHHHQASCIFTDDLRVCSRETTPIVAVIAPKPLSLSSAISIYFFDTPYLDKEDSSEETPKYFSDNRYLIDSKEEPDVDAFPNGLFPLRGHWQSLKYAFSHYLETHGWKRIAIVSDDSYYSQVFERKLVEHLEQKGFVYNVERCVTTRYECHFDKALSFFRRNKAFIIIANIQAANANNLVKSANKFHMVSSRYVWLARDWPFEDVGSPMFEQTVSLTLSPMPAPDYKMLHDGALLNSVWRGLALVAHAIKSANKTDSIDAYYQSVYNEMNATNRCDRSKLFIHTFSSGKLIDIHSTEIHYSGLVGVYPKDVVMGKVSDLAEFCLVRSNSFRNPCNDTWVVAICVVWFVFIIMMVLLFYFFNSCLVWT